MAIRGLSSEFKLVQITERQLFLTYSCTQLLSMELLTMFEAIMELRMCWSLIIWKVSMALGAISGVGKSYPCRVFVVACVLSILINLGVFTTRGLNDYGLRSPGTLDQNGKSSSMSLKQSVDWTPTPLDIYGSCTTSSWTQSMKTLISGQQCGTSTNFKSKVDVGGAPERYFLPACCKMDHEAWSWDPLATLHSKREVLWTTQHLRTLFLQDVQVFPRST